MNEFEIREATLADAGVLAGLMIEMDGMAVPPDADAIEATRDALLEMAAYPDFRAWLVWRDGVAIGTFSLMIFSSPSHLGARQAMLDAVVVAQDQRGAGVGQAMLHRAMAMAREAGCYKMTLSSNLKRVAAHGFYEQLGFRQHGISFYVAL